MTYKQEVIFNLAILKSMRNIADLLKQTDTINSEIIFNIVDAIDSTIEAQENE